ncbi:Nucleotide-diphospho-sugar transferase [Arabidopsis thaliana x Arabidopsis arenosa]|uniref:Nucleotide-diphospho-sugar transferase n=1 Tax=Arabidopsis thaliana x Arabidopsis arenosa TaxID=1240361 RepID=A0A8T1YDP1_9BRAS|nr:Nucleotide-diphospho-sugar transferase [Arabidopsis thaliana x Arabidopsis arenosa]
MKIVRIVKSPYLVICCLLLIILWLLSHHHHHNHHSCASYMNTISGTQFSHLQPESSGLSSLLKEAATEDRVVIITMVDREWAKPDSILDLFLESLRIGERTKHLLNHLIVVALDDQALRYCRRAHPHCYLYRGSRKKSSESLKPDGLVTGWSKKSLVKEILELGYHIMFTEADVMWLRNPLMHCHPQNHISVACGLSLSDHQHDHLTTENTGGFFFAKSNDITIDFFNILNVERVLYPTTGNQSLCDIVKREDVVDALDKKVTYLDDANFGRFCQPNPQDRSKITTVHASCCNDTKSKVHYLKLLLQDRKNMNPQWKIPSQCGGFYPL